MLFTAILALYCDKNDVFFDDIDDDGAGDGDGDDDEWLPWQVAKAASASLNNCVNCLPGLREVDQIVKHVSTVSVKLTTTTQVRYNYYTGMLLYNYCTGTVWHYTGVTKL